MLPNMYWGEKLRRGIVLCIGMATLVSMLFSFPRNA